MLVHPRNRGGLGINAFNSHITGGKIVRVGADLDELRKATVIEMSHDESERELQFAFNKRLIARSKGLLAPVRGHERFLTVACSHTVVFCRVVTID